MTGNVLFNGKKGRLDYGAVVSILLCFCTSCLLLPNLKGIHDFIRSEDLTDHMNAGKELLKLLNSMYDFKYISKVLFVCLTQNASVT